MNKQVTAIVQQAKNKKRANLYLDGEFACGIDSFTLLENRIKVGDVVSTEHLNEILSESEVRSATEVLLKFISKSLKTKRQAKDKLLSYGYTEEVCNLAIKKVEEYGYLDDVDYANRYISTYHKQKGKLLLKCELLKKGVPQDVIESALSNIDSQTNELKAILGKYLRGKELDVKTLQKAYRHLLSKGFSCDEINEVMANLKNEEY